MFKAAFALLLLPAALAAEPAPYRIWKASDLRTSGKRLATTIDANKVSSESQGDFGGYATSLTHREGNGEAEVHAATTDIFIVQSGAATVVLGGKVAKARNIGPGEIRGPSIDGVLNMLSRPATSCKSRPERHIRCWSMPARRSPISSSR
jgi:hypothetical protein